MKARQSMHIAHCMTHNNCRRPVKGHPRDSNYMYLKEMIHELLKVIRVMRVRKVIYDYYILLKNI